MIYLSTYKQIRPKYSRISVLNITQNILANIEEVRKRGKMIKITKSRNNIYVYLTYNSFVSCLTNQQTKYITLVKIKQ